MFMKKYFSPLKRNESHVSNRAQTSEALKGFV